jgi:hypothetical protein
MGAKKGKSDPNTFDVIALKMGKRKSRGKLDCSDRMVVKMGLVRQIKKQKWPSGLRR